MQSPDALTDLFRANGWKITAQRQCIFRALEGDETHPSAERVFERVRREMPNVSLKTVYQTLHDLAELGEISALDLGTGSARFDPNTESSHHHVVCRSCGKVRDVEADFPELRVPPAAHLVSTSSVPRSSSAACAASAGEGTVGAQQQSHTSNLNAAAMTI
jgi:Fe2+ or Zn2+ uptake regulation protein